MLVLLTYIVKITKCNFGGIFTLYSLRERYLLLQGAWTKLICSLLNTIRLGGSLMKYPNLKVYLTS